MNAAVHQALDAGLRGHARESLTKDRTGQMMAWIPPIKTLLKKETPVYVYFNNRNAGYAPGSVEFFVKLFSEDV